MISGQLVPGTISEISGFSSVPSDIILYEVPDLWIEQCNPSDQWSLFADNSANIQRCQNGS